MVAISPKPIHLATELLEMPLSRGCAFGLQLTLQPEVPFVYFFPSSFSKELPIGCYRRAIQPKVNAHNLSIGDKYNIWNSQHHMQKESASFVNQISRVKAHSFVKPLLGVSVHPKLDNLSARDSGKANRAVFDYNPIASSIISDRQRFGMWTRSFIALLLESKRRLHRLSGYHPGSTNKLRRKVGILCSQFVIGSLVQLYAILDSFIETKCGNGIKALSVLLHRVKQYGSLLCRRLKFYSDSSLHSHMLSDFTENVKFIERSLPHSSVA
jgi:hypothetical protein